MLPDRRQFLRGTTAAALSLSATSYARTAGANDRLRVAFLGCGARAQAHIHVVNRLPGVTPVMVCDVWDGHADEYAQTHGGKTTTRRYCQGLRPSAVACGLDPADPTQAVKDYRRVLDRPDIDIVCIATPDHWHARMTLDAVAAGKDVFCETPLTRTAAEASAVVEALTASGRVLSAGVQSLTHPAWQVARDLVRGGRIGPVAHLSAGVFRSDGRGEWRYYRVLPEMTAGTVDWPMFRGDGFAVNGVPIGPDPAACPFDPATFAQWRCDGAFSGGPLTDWLFAPAARLIAAAGLDAPTRVVAAGGLFHDRDGRTVPDTVTVAADYPGCQLVLSASTAASLNQDEVIRGRHGAIRLLKSGVEVVPHDPAGGRPGPVEVIPAPPPAHDTEALWVDFLDCVRRRDRATASPPGIGAAASTLLALAGRSLAGG